MLSKEDNRLMCEMPSFDEIWKVLCSMLDLKVSSYNGFIVAFYKKCWQTMGPKVVAIIQGVFELGHMLKKLNASFIVLVSKNPRANQLKFKPISLCNIIYKVTAKLPTSRMRKVLQSTISLEWSTFVLGD